MSEELSEKHTNYIVKLLSMRDTLGVWSKKHIEMNGYFWCVNALYILKQANTDLRNRLDLDWLVPFIISCHNQDGGFAASVGCDSSISATLCALQILVLLDEGNLLLDIKEKTLLYVCSLYQDNGTFLGEALGEVDVQYIYSALYCLRILGGMKLVNLQHIAQYLHSCLNWDGAFGNSPKNESHAGSTYCCLAALKMIDQLDCVLNRDEKKKAGEWLSHRQNRDGGLCGRPNKKSDSCYSWWVFTSLCILDKSSWVDVSQLKEFIYACQDKIHGGFGDKPGTPPDPYHTFFALAALSVIGSHQEATSKGTMNLHRVSFTSALPEEIDTFVSSCE